MFTMMRIWSIFILLTVWKISTSHAYRNSDRCETITIPLCAEMKYNLTSMPNMVGHSNQQEAALDINEFIPLVQIGCSNLLKFFLCSLYAPMCTEQVDETLVIPACRSMCLEVKAKCEPILQRFNFKWPPKLDCSTLPERSGRTNLCMEAPNIGEDVGDIDSITRGFTPNPKWNTGVRTTFQPRPPPHRTLPPAPSPRFRCPDRFVQVDKNGKNGTCAPRCKTDVFYRQEDKTFAEIWMIVWSSLCLASTLLTVLTFLLDSSRFQYPERPIIFLSMCYLVHSLAYLIRAALGPTAIACGETTTGVPYLIQDGLDSMWCIIVFLVLYFFGMASCLWWVVLTLTWYMAAGRKWGREAIQNLSTYFHVAAWVIPALKTIVLLLLHKVDGDELTGLCYVGSMDGATLVGLVLAPLVIYLVVGTTFILAGFFAMFRIRHDLKQEGGNPHIRKLEKLMAKIGVFSVLYTVPATCVIACHMYELLHVHHWRAVAMVTSCDLIQKGRRAGELDCTLNKSIPTVEVYMLKIFMSLVVGITSGMWVWSSKSVDSWHSFICGTVLGKNRTNANKYNGVIAGRNNVVLTQRNQNYYMKCPNKSLKNTHKGMKSNQVARL